MRLPVVQRQRAAMRGCDGVGDRKPEAKARRFVAAGIVVGFVIDELRRNRQFKHEQQRFLLGIADRLSKLSPRPRVFARGGQSDAATILSEREGWLSHF
jgi:hypothetical protein